jgi:aryl-alcohol dehydrogenase-like predicted oxidoreductase
VPSASVGKALADGRRDHVVLATKLTMPMGDDPNQRGTSRRWIVEEVESSLRRLNTDWIDLYQVHRPTLDTDLEETLGALDDLVHQGKVRYIGHSTYPGSLIVEAQWVARDRRLQRFVSEQPP